MERRAPSPAPGSVAVGSDGGALAGEGRRELLNPMPGVVLEDPADHGGFRLEDPPLDVAVHADVDVAVDHAARDVPGFRLPGERVVGPGAGLLAL